MADRSRSAPMRRPPKWPSELLSTTVAKVQAMLVVSFLLLWTEKDVQKCVLIICLQPINQEYFREKVRIKQE